MSLLKIALNDDLRRFYEEDDLNRNAFYLESLSSEMIECHLKVKSDIFCSGIPFFIEAFEYIGGHFTQLDKDKLLNLEGRKVEKGTVVSFHLPFSIALTGERVALNLLQQACRISTYTHLFVKKTSPTQIKILDTRKTTPGLRQLEKYAVRIGGGYNHRYGQADSWMIKDNHKTFFGGLEKAWKHFQNLKTFYQSIIVEIHDLNEFKQALDLGIQHVMLDNFSIQDLKEAITLKKPNMTIEVSGGIKLDNIEQYLIEGIDAISIGALTHSAPHVDLSMKMKRIEA
jgi:nicotinate-nucleotide pyrophosphorylase (carboxylating)